MKGRISPQFWPVYRRPQPCPISSGDTIDRISIVQNDSTCTFPNQIHSTSDNKTKHEPDKSTHENPPKLAVLHRKPGGRAEMIFSSNTDQRSCDEHGSRRNNELHTKRWYLVGSIPSTFRDVIMDEGPMGGLCT